MTTVVGALWSCGGRRSSAEKTQAQRAEEYHKNLTTGDLTLYDLKGNVRCVVYPNGFLSQYGLSATAGSADSILFSPTGLCETFPTLGSDTLLAVRNTVGTVRAFTHPDGDMVMSALFDESGMVQSWTMGDTICSFAYEDNRLKSVDVAVGGKTAAHIAVKVLSVDKVGNWTRRLLTAAGHKAVTQCRRITYY